MCKLPIDIHMDFIPLPGFGPDHFIFSSVTTAQLKLVPTPQPSMSPGIWHGANFWETQANLGEPPH